MPVSINKRQVAADRSPSILACLFGDFATVTASFVTNVYWYTFFTSVTAAPSR